MTRSTRLLAACAALSLGLLGCEAEEDPVSPDPDGLQEPADDPEGVDEDPDAEPGTGEPAVEGDGEGRLTPEDEDG